MRPVILASHSPQRISLLTCLGVPFKSVPSNIDEKAEPEKNPVTRAVTLAQRKGELVSASFPDAVVVAADTFLYNAQETIYEKPATKEEAKKMLSEMSGQELTTVTGFYYHDPLEEVSFLGPVLTTCMIRELSETEIEQYVASQPVTTWSGSLSPAYEPGMALIASSSGSFTSFTHGLPLELVDQLLKQSKILPLQQA